MKIFIGLCLMCFIIVMGIMMYLGNTAISNRQKKGRAIEAWFVAVGIALATVLPTPWEYIGEVLSIILLLDLILVFSRTYRSRKRFNQYVKKNQRDVAKTNRLISEQKIPMQAFDVMYLHKHHKFYLSPNQEQWLTDYVNHYSKHEQQLIYAVARITFSHFSLDVLNKKGHDFGFKKFQQKLIDFRKHQESRA